MKIFPVPHFLEKVTKKKSVLLISLEMFTEIGKKNDQQEKETEEQKQEKVGET